MPTALVTCLHLQRDFDRLRPEFEQLGVEPLLPDVEGQQLGAAQMAELLPQADAAIVGDDEIDAAAIEAAAAAGLVGIVKWGIGVDAIDLAAAQRRGVPVFNTPGVFADEVADLALSHLLLLTRQAHLMHASVLDGGWRQTQGRSLRGLTAGVLGLGSIGAAIARRLTALGMEVIGHDVRQVSEAEHGVPDLQQVELDALCERSDVIVVACRLTADNQGMLSRERFSLMRPGVLVINVARGPLIDETALVDALADGTVAGAGLDVFEHEPLPAGAPIRRFSDRCVFTTHNGSNTAEAVARINRLTTDIVFDLLGVKGMADGPPSRVA